MTLYPEIGGADPHWLVKPARGKSEAMDPSHKTRVSRALVPGENTVNLIFWGQSQVTNMNTAIYTPASSRVHNFSLYDGGMWSGRSPALGSSLVNSLSGRRYSGGGWVERLADKVVASTPVDRCIYTPFGIGGTSIANWVFSGQPGSVPAWADYSERWRVALRRLSEARLFPSKTGAAIGTVATAVIVQIGETDAGSVGWTGLATTWTARMQSIVASVRALGVPADVPWFFIQSTHNFTTSRTDIRAAQAAMNNPAAATYLLCDADTLIGADPAVGANRQSDDIHFNTTGCEALANLALAGLQAYGAPFA